MRGGVTGFAPAKLRAIRTRANITVENLAAALQVSSSTVRKWELGTASPRPAHLAALSDVLDRPTEEFLRSPENRQLRQLRESAGLTLQAAAKAAGVGTSTVNRVELGSQRPGSPLLQALAAVYGVTTAELESAWESTVAAAAQKARRAARGE